MGVLIGTSGWSYPHWRKRFYPEDLRLVELLHHYGQTFSTVEINTSFYHLPSAQVFENWRRAVPSGFVFAVKASRYLTHVKKFKDAEESWDRLYTNLLSLEEKLGPVLFQCPPNWSRNTDRLREFVRLLPEGRLFAFEFRHPSWFEEDVYKVLTEAKAALCLADSPKYPLQIEVTAPFVFIRFHGGRAGAGSEYSDEELGSWANRIGEFKTEGLDIYAYFNNDAAGYAVRNALSLERMLRE